MLKNYFLIAWRHLLKNKGYSLINIVGLATGMAIALLIGLWIADEASFDHYSPGHKRLAEIMNNASTKDEYFTGRNNSNAPRPGASDPVYGPV